MQTGGVWLYYKVQQLIVQHEMESDIDEIGICSQKFDLSQKEYAKSKINEHEILIKGKLYDIKSVIISAGRAEIVVINDTREERILEDLKKLGDTNNRHNKSLPSHCFNILTLFYLSTEINNTPGELIAVTKNFRNYNDNIISNGPAIDSPPPKIG